MQRKKRPTAKRKLGRPRRPEGMERIAIHIPGNLKRWLQHRAIDEGKDMGQLVTEAIRLYRSRRK
jgi:hypothetical protein